MNDEPALRALRPASALQPTTNLARFAAHSGDVRERSYHLWSSVAGRNAVLTASLLQREAEDGTPIPAGSTVRRWAAEEDWDARADADLTQTSGRTLAALRAGWLGALAMAQQVLIAGLAGDLDDLPHAGAARLKSAELVLKTLQTAGATIVPSESAVRPLEDDSTLSLTQRARRARARLYEENARS
jgi:hypothetical protein